MSGLTERIARITFRTGEYDDSVYFNRLRDAFIESKRLTVQHIVEARDVDGIYRLVDTVTPKGCVA